MQNLDFTLRNFSYQTQRDHNLDFPNKILNTAGLYSSDEG